VCRVFTERHVSDIEQPPSCFFDTHFFNSVFRRIRKYFQKTLDRFSGAGFVVVNSVTTDWDDTAVRRIPSTTILSFSKPDVSRTNRKQKPIPEPLSDCRIRVRDSLKRLQRNLKVPDGHFDVVHIKFFLSQLGLKKDNLKGISIGPQSCHLASQVPQLLVPQQRMSASGRLSNLT
jgi:hypothetical protein